MVTPNGSMSTEGETLQFLSYLTGARYFHPWWRRGRCQSCNQVPATHVQRVWPTLQVIDMSTLGDAADVNPVIKFLPHTLRGRNLITGLASAVSPRVDTSSTCKVGQKLGVSLPLLTCSPSAWPSRLLYRRGRKSRKDLWITLHMPYQLPCPCNGKCYEPSSSVHRSWWTTSDGRFS